MDRVEVTSLPGVGVLRTFLTATDDWIGVLELPGGRRQLFVDDPSDPDTRRLAASLQPQDSELLAELLGGVPEDPTAASEGADLVDWVMVAPDSAAAGQTIAELGLRSSTGAQIVAVLRDHAYTDFDSDFQLRVGDIVIVTGGQPALAAANSRLRGERSRS